MGRRPTQQHKNGIRSASSLPVSPPSPLSSREVVTFLIALAFGTPHQNVFRTPKKTVILSEAPRGSIA
jgi:hypothetical protein